MKRFVTCLATIAVLSGCTARPVQEQTDYELCSNAALSLRNGDSDKFFAIKSEVQRRKSLGTLHISSDDCGTAGTLAVNKAIQNQQTAAAINATLQQVEANRPKTTSCNSIGNSTGNVYGNTYSTLGNVNTTCTTY